MDGSGRRGRADLLERVGAKMLQTRWVARTPIWVYRAGLGCLYGHRLLMLEHLGRVSGARRYVVLEVVERAEPTEYVVAAGFGMRAQWYRNILADPRVRLWCGGLRGVRARASALSPQESAKAIADYERRHPAAWARLRSTIEMAVGDPVTTLPMVRITAVR